LGGRPKSGRPISPLSTHQIFEKRSTEKGTIQEKDPFPARPRKRSHHEQAEEAFETAAQRNLAREKKFVFHKEIVLFSRQKCTGFG
jgi:hypothetical protein